MHPYYTLLRDGTNADRPRSFAPFGFLRDGKVLTSASTLNLTVHSFLGAHASGSNGRYSQRRNDITGLDYALAQHFCGERAVYYRADYYRREMRITFSDPTRSFTTQPPASIKRSLMKKARFTAAHRAMLAQMPWANPTAFLATQ